MELQQRYQQQIGTKRSAVQIRLVDLLIERPVITTVLVSRQFDVTYQTAKNNIKRLVKIGILRQQGTAKRNRIYVAEGVLEIISRPFVG